jgi:hypothetical protein
MMEDSFSMQDRKHNSASMPVSPPLPSGSLMARL